MFNNATNCGYSLSDIAAITGRNNSGFGDGNGWWIILLFLFILMGNGWDDNGMRRIGAVVLVLEPQLEKLFIMVLT